VKGVMEMKKVRSVRLITNYGDIVIELDMENSPVTCENFLSYCTENFYDGTIFHRIIPGFMAQGGGFDPMVNDNMPQKPVKSPILNEADNGLSNDRGTIAMARTGVPHSATAQFFINYADNGFLNHTEKTQQGWGYAVFGKVIEGMDIADSMSDAETQTIGGHQNVPVNDIIIESTEIIP
jgi:peptidyl-prolyl cis-trans isomerase B (cyclophilin B)